MRLSIIIVNWNTRDLLRQCLLTVREAARSLSSSEVEILVVDNASTDGSVAMLKEQFPSVKLIQNQENVGFARANNEALEISTGRYCMLLNPDTELSLIAIDSLLGFMEKTPESGAAGPLVLNPDKTLQLSCYPRPTLTREIWYLFHLDRFYPYARHWMHRWTLDSPRSVDVVLGACMILRREAIDDVGMFDPDYFMYSEEVDLCYRIRRAGWGVHWVPSAQIVHWGGQSTRLMASEMFLSLYRSKILYFRKNEGDASARIYKIILFVAASLRIVLSPPPWLFNSSREGGLRRQRASNYLRLVENLRHM